jgi:hypothetical protein
MERAFGKILVVAAIGDRIDDWRFIMEASDAAHISNSISFVIFETVAVSHYNHHVLEPPSFNHIQNL